MTASTQPPAISVHNLSKRYFVYDNQRTRLRHAFWPSNTAGVSEVWALQKLDFDVQQGESVGIIGRNGAGKSSLLQIITRTLAPTSGDIMIRGRVGALLELGSGFHPDYSGTDNLILNGLLLGLSRDEVEQRFEEIASFADIGDVLDRPAKTYSSGMLMRLAFSLQMALKPDILIVDEALSVGDYFFQQKCFARIRQMREDGLTLLFVSHDMGTVRDICDRALYLKEGRQLYLGDAKEAARKYLSDGTAPTELPPATYVPSSPIADIVDFGHLIEESIWSCDLSSTGRLLAVHLLDKAGQHITHVTLGATMVVRVSFRTQGTSRPLSIMVLLKNKYGQLVISTGNRLLNIQIMDDPGGNVAIFELEIDMRIEAGLYSCKVVCSDQPNLSEDGTRDDSGWMGPVQVNWNYEHSQPPFFGMFGLPVRSRGVTFCSKSLV